MFLRRRNESICSRRLNRTRIEQKKTERTEVATRKIPIVYCAFSQPIDFFKHTRITPPQPLCFLCYLLFKRSRMNRTRIEQKKTERTEVTTRKIPLVYCAFSQSIDFFKHTRITPPHPLCFLRYLLLKRSRMNRTRIEQKKTERTEVTTRKIPIVYCAITQSIDFFKHTRITPPHPLCFLRYLLFKSPPRISENQKIIPHKETRCY